MPTSDVPARSSSTTSDGMDSVDMDRTDSGVSAGAKSGAILEGKPFSAECPKSSSN
jgi:hypothetical protein